MKVLIHGINTSKAHSTSWWPVWENYCKQHNIEYQVVNLFAIDPIKVLPNFDILVWHFSQYVYTDMLEARSILYTAKHLGLKVFPDFNDAWHFDDKVAEMYILKAVGAPIPWSMVYYDKQTLMESAKEFQFPMVAKLRTGSGSHNVKLIKNLQQLEKYANRMFSKGFRPAPSLLYKTSSNIRSTHNWKTLISKYKRIPEFLRILSNAKQFPNEKGYVYLQEFIPNDNFDMKIAVVGDKLSSFYRPVRSHDFRASGGGEFLYDRSLITKEIVQSAFETADKMGLKCVGFDYVVDKRTGKGLIVEISYGFSHTAIMGANGYFDRNYVWHEGPLNAPEELLKNLIKECSAQ